MSFVSGLCSSNDSNADDLIVELEFDSKPFEVCDSIDKAFTQVSDRNRSDSSYKYISNRKKTFQVEIGKMICKNGFLFPISGN